MPKDKLPTRDNNSTDTNNPAKTNTDRRIELFHLQYADRKVPSTLPADVEFFKKHPPASGQQTMVHNFKKEIIENDPAKCAPDVSIEEYTTIVPRFKF